MQKNSTKVVPTFFSHKIAVFMGNIKEIVYLCRGVDSLRFWQWFFEFGRKGFFVDRCRAAERVVPRGCNTSVRFIYLSGRTFALSEESLEVGGGELCQIIRLFGGIIHGTRGPLINRMNRQPKSSKPLVIPFLLF